MCSATYEFLTLAGWILWPVKPVFELWEKINEGLCKQLSSKEPKLFHLFPLHSQGLKEDKYTIFYGWKKMKAEYSPCNIPQISKLLC